MLNRTRGSRLHVREYIGSCLKISFEGPVSVGFPYDSKYNIEAREGLHIVPFSPGFPSCRYTMADESSTQEQGQLQHGADEMVMSFFSLLGW